MPEDSQSNPVVASYREFAKSRGVDERRTDEELTRDLGDAFRARDRMDIEKSQPEFRSQYLKARRQDAPGALTEAVRGFKRGVQEGGAAIGGVTEMVARQTGNEKVADAARGFTERRVESMQSVEGPSVQSHRDIRTPGDAFRWLAGHAGQMLPVTGAMAAAGAVGAAGGTATAGPAGTVVGGVGGAIASRVLAQQAMRQLVKTGVEKGAAKIAAQSVARLATEQAKQKALKGVAMKAGGLAGAFVPMETSYVGDLYNTAIEQGATHNDAAKSALVFGTAGAMVETIYPARVGAMLMRKLSGEVGEQAAKKTMKTRMKGILKEAGVGGAMEGSSEAMAEAFVIAGESMAIPGYKIDAEQIRSRLEHAFVAGAALGGVMGGAAGAIPSRSARPTGEPTAEVETPAPAETPETPDAAIDTVLDRFMDTTSEPAVAAELGRTLAEEIESTPVEQRTAEQEEYVQWWSQNMEAIENDARSPEALERLNQVLAEEEAGGPEAIDSFTQQALVEQQEIPGETRTPVDDLFDADTQAALADALAIGDDPFVQPSPEPTTNPAEISSTPVVATELASPETPNATQVPDSQQTEMDTQGVNPPVIRPLLTDFNPDGTIQPVQLRTELLPMPTDMARVVEGAGEPGTTASQTRNFVAVRMPDGTVETRGVFQSSQGIQAHSKINQTTEQDIADAVGTTKPEVSKVLNEFRDTGNLRGKTEKVRERSQRIVDTAEEMGYEHGTKHTKLDTLLAQEGVETIGFFQTEGIPPQMVQRFKDQAEFDAAFGETASVSRAQRGGLAEFVGTDPERATIDDVAELAGVSVEEARSVFQKKKVDPGLQQSVRQAADELGYGEGRSVPIKASGEKGPGIDLATTAAVQEDAPTRAGIYGQLQRWGVSESLVANIGGIPGVVALGRKSPEQIIQRLKEEMMRVMPPNARRVWESDIDPEMTEARNQMLKGLYRDLSEMAANKNFSRKQNPDEFRRGDTTLNQRFADLTATFARLGVTLELKAPDANAADPFWHGEGGRFIPSNRTVQLSMTDILNPSERNLRDLLHEAAHDLFSRESQGTQQLLHDMIARMDPADLSFYGETRADPRARIDDPAGLGRRVVTEEMLVEHLTFQGIERETARSMVRQLIDAVKELLLKAALQFQRAFNLSEPISDFLAREYIETRWQRMMDGSPVYNAESWLGKLGGRKLTYGEASHFFTLVDDGGYSEMHNPFTGEIKIKSVLNDSPAAMAHNRNAIIASVQTEAIHGRDVQNEVAEKLLGMEAEEAGIRLHVTGRAIQVTEARKARERHLLKQNAMISIAENNTVNRFITWALARAKQDDPSLTRETLMQRMEISYDPLEMAQVESQAQTEYGDPVSVDLRLEDLPTGEAKSLAEIQATKRIHEIEIKLATRLGRLNADIQNSRDYLDGSQARFEELAKGVTNIKIAEQQARTALRADIERLARDVKAQSRGDIAAGDAAGVLRTLLELKEDDTIPSTYAKVLKNLVSNDTPIFSYIQKIQRISRDTLDAGTHNEKEIRQAVIEQANRGDADLKELTHGERGSALLSVLITFVKNEAHIATAMEIQQLEATVQRAVAADLQAMLHEHTDQGFDRIIERARAMPRSAQNDIIIAFANKRKEMASRSRKIKRDTAARDTVQHAYKESTRLAGELEGLHQVGPESPMGDGYQFIAPFNPKATSEQIMARPEKEGDKNPHWATLRTAEGFATSNAEKERMVRRGLAFVREREASNDPAALDRVYQRAKADVERLGKIVADNAVQPFQRRWFDTHMKSLVDRLKRGGVAASRRAAQMWERRQVIVKPNEGRAMAGGVSWEGAENRFLKAAKIKNSQFKFYEREIYNVSRHWLETEATADRTPSMLELKAILSQNPIIRDAINQPGAWDAFVEFMEKTDTELQWRKSIVEKEGGSIRDDSLGMFKNEATGKMEYYTRSMVKGGLAITTRRISDQFRGVITEMRSKGWWSTDKDRAAFIARLEENPEAARAELRQLVSPTIQVNFIERLLNNNAGVVIDRPMKPGGVKMKADIGFISEAWHESGGDLLTFAEKLYQLHTGEVNPEASIEYAGQVIDTIGGYFLRLGKDYVKEKEEAPGGHVTMDEVNFSSLNARTSRDLPSQFFKYDRFNSHDNRFWLERVASQLAFGRDYKDLFALYDQLEADLLSRETRMNHEKEAIILEKPELETDKRGMERALKERMGSDYELMKDIRTARKTMNSKILRDQTKGILEGPSGVTGDTTVWQHVMGFIVSMLVNNPKTGLRNMTSNNDVIRLLGASPLTIKAATEAWMASGFQGRASLLSLIGKNIIRGNERHMQLVEASIGDDFATKTKLRDLLIQRGPDAQWADEGFGGKIKQWLAVTGSLIMQTPINPLGAQQEAAGVRPLAPFPPTQIISNRTTAYGMLTAYEGAARGVAEFYRSNQDKITNEDYKVTAKDAGFTRADEVAVFDRMVEFAKFAGFTMEQIGLQALSNPSKKRFPFDMATVQKIGLMAINHVSGESNPTNRPAGSFSNFWGRLSIPLVGWSLWSFNLAGGMLRDAKGHRDLKTTALGLSSLLLVVAPAAVVYSVFFDEYDRRLLGKQPNIRPMTSTDPKEATLGLVERLNAMGVFGIGGEAMVGVINLRDSTGQRILSVDERVVWLNTFGRLQQTIGTILAQGPTNTSYASTWRNLFQGTIGGGPIQAMQMTNTILGHPPIPGLRAESAVTQRINAQNWLRAQGRNMGMEIRAGGGFARPTPVTPHVTNMQLAAIRDDPEAFMAAYNRAVREAAKMPTVDDPADHVRRSYQGRHPLKNVYRTPPSPQQYQAILKAMPKIGREAVSSAIDNYNRYGQRMGVTPYVGSSEKVASSKGGAFGSGFTGGFDSAMRDAFRSGF